MMAGFVVTMASLMPPIYKRNVSPYWWLYWEKTATGLRTMAGESAKERKRETVGMEEANVKPRNPDGERTPWAIS